jgi:hypothetical protein
MALTKVTSGVLADDAVGVASLSATGTASASTFLRGDNAWASAAAGFSDMKFKTASDTYTVPTGITKIVIDLISAGGGGGGSGGNWASGGSAGANAIKTLTVSVGQTYTLTIGAVGAAVTGSGTGGTGGTASFVNASGTTVNLQCTGGGGGKDNAAAVAGGLATGGDLNIDGATGGSGISGGQSAHLGAPSRWGFSGAWTTNVAAGAQAGVGYGAGGCAAYAVASGVSRAGQPGLCVITEYK